MGLHHYKISISFVLLSIFFFFFLSKTARAHDHDLKDITELCKHTDHLALCNSIVRNKAGNAVEATIMAIQATILHAQAALKKTDRLMESQKGMGKMNLQTCREVYDDAISNLQSSIEVAKTKSLADLKINLSAVMSDFGTCEDGYTESADDAFPMQRTNDLLKNLASVSLALACEVKE